MYDTTTMLRSLALVGLLTTAAWAGDSSDCAPERLVGEWLTPNGELVVEIQRDDDGFHGTIVRFTEAFWSDPRRAAQRDDPAARARIEELLGTEILSDFRCDDGRWVGGTVYAPDKDRRVDGTIEVDGREFELTVKRGFMKRTKTWSRVTDPENEES